MSEPPHKHPYKGLVPYEEADAAFFRGRDKETRMVIANLYAAPLTLLCGASGVGKSSLLRAGVVKKLRERSDVLVVFFNKWKGDALGALKAEVLKCEAEIVTRWPAAQLVEASGAPAEQGATTTLENFLSETVTLIRRRVILILDQFDEYFLYHPAGEGDGVAEQLPDAVIQTEVPVSFLISIRDDALAQLDRFEDDIPILFDNYLRVEHLELNAARTAIIEPLEEYNARRRPGDPQASIPPPLVEEILEDVSSFEPAANRGGTLRKVEKSSARRVRAPYLQLVMTRMWDEEMRRQSRSPSCVLRPETFRSLGRAAGIFNSHMRLALKNLSWGERRMASRVFLHLVSASGTKIALSAQDIADRTRDSHTKIKRLLDRLAKPDILLLRRFESQTREGTQNINYEIYHDILAWPLLKWRENHIRHQRLLTLLLPASLVLLLIAGFLILLNHNSPGVFDIGEYLILAPIILAVTVPFLLIGFFIGRFWARLR